MWLEHLLSGAPIRGIPARKYQDRCLSVILIIVPQPGIAMQWWPESSEFDFSSVFLNRWSELRVLSAFGLVAQVVRALH